MTGRETGYRVVCGWTSDARRYGREAGVHHNAGLARIDRLGKQSEDQIRRSAKRAAEAEIAHDACRFGAELAVVGIAQADRDLQLIGRLPVDLPEARIG